MDVNSLPKTFTRQRRYCDLNPGPSAPVSSTLTTRLPSHPRPNYARETRSVLRLTADTLHLHCIHSVVHGTNRRLMLLLMAIPLGGSGTFRTHVLFTGLGRLVYLAPRAAGLRAVLM